MGDKLMVQKVLYGCKKYICGYFFSCML